MRYYSIQITGTGNAPSQTWTSHPNGPGAPPDPGALDVVFDMLTYAYAPSGFPDISTGINAQDWVRVLGIPLSTIAQAHNLNGANVAIYGGMGVGLPLANPSQAGLLCRGIVWNPFANWIGTAMTLEFFVTAASPFTVGTEVTPAHQLPFTWKAGTPLATAIQQTLQVAFPTYKTSINISPNLVLNHDEVGFYRTMPQFAAMIKAISKPITGQGVDIALVGNTFRVFDGTSQSSPKQIAFTDLIGQPTWIGFKTMSITTVMRGDISVGDYVQLPPTIVTSTPAAMGALSQLRQAPVFTGTFLVNKLRHTGNYKRPDADAWVSVFEAIYQG